MKHKLISVHCGKKLHSAERTPTTTTCLPAQQKNGVPTKKESYGWSSRLIQLYTVTAVELSRDDDDDGIKNA